MRNEMINGIKEKIAMLDKEINDIGILLSINEEEYGRLYGEKRYHEAYHMLSDGYAMSHYAESLYKKFYGLQFQLERLSKES